MAEAASARGVAVRASDVAVEMAGVSKRFGSVQALHAVDFSCRAGEVHALLGENGAGKTSLMNVLAGLYRADAGTIRLHGRVVEMRSPRNAIAHDIGMVHQHFELVRAFSAFENIVLGVEKRVWSMDADRHRGAIAKLARRYGFDVDLDRHVRDLEIGDQQKVEILRILATGARVLILDEPTTHLTPIEVERLFGSVREFARSGLTVILIAHKLREILAVADRLTVLRRGRLVGTLDAADADEPGVVEMMIGERGALGTASCPRTVVGPGTVLAVRGAASAEDQRAVDLADVDLTVRSGELVGVAGVAGNGQKELVELLCGLRPLAAGSILLGERDVSRCSVRERIRAGLATLPGDRIREGILPGAPLFESYALGLHQIWDRGGWQPGTVRDEAQSMIGRFRVVAPGADAPTAVLSGGNIQKVLVARALAIAGQGGDSVLVAMNPTSGLDVGAAAFVHGQLGAMCSRGAGVLLISEDLEELLAICHRILVLYRGRVVGSYEREAFDRYAIGAGMVGSGD